MEETEDAVEDPEGFALFDTTLEHGLVLHKAYENTVDGKRELTTLSPELQAILQHYKSAAELWVGNREQDGG